ncbi:DUF4279 domain-containing protein [Actinoplanes sp. M2I2]|uniref:DUF4279 domain-containing protein n=1 Tax=Actinoplanes sp. M2I2 TaxID=1734444 RepID=UPI002020A0B5|nr:DUF4279 domain-containing protein [Actinoplanes sp. M2I2]
MTGRSRLAFVVRSGALGGDEISRRLGLRPTDVSERGEPVSRRHPDRLREWTTWSLTSPAAQSDVPADHLRALLPVVEARIPALRRLEAEGATLFWSYFVVAKPLGATFGFEPDLLSRLAEVGVSLDFDVYDSDDAG